MVEISEKTTREALLSAAQSLCNDFSTGSSTSTILSHFTSASSTDSTLPTAYEHGHFSLAPFLGRVYKGRPGVEQYFSMLQHYLTFENMMFSDYIIDEVKRIVCVRGEARFTWKETGKGWDEVFTYRLGFAEEDIGGKGVWKVSKYEVWADSGSL
jgi:hypothetical protein